MGRELSSSMHFVGCGVQFRFGPLWISNLLVEFPLSTLGVGFSSVCGLCELPSRYLEELCVLWVVDSNLLAEFPCFGTVDCFYHPLYVCGC